jgi:large subunit ribosomal protein L2
MYSNSILTYIIAPGDITVGKRIFTSIDVEIRAGYATPLKNIPIGIKIHNIELKYNKGAQLIRAAGTYATIISKLEDYVVIKLKSGELRKIHAGCIGTIGTVSNFTFGFRKFLKASYYRFKGWRPVVRGVAMNPIDHPHGGGQGKTSGGRPSVTPKGIITKGKRTRQGINTMVVVKRIKYKK